MKKLFKTILSGSLPLCLAFGTASCSDNDKDNPEEPKDDVVQSTIGFENVAAEYFGGPTSYGANLYNGTQGQITTGYLAKVSEDTYAQFSINYGYNYDDPSFATQSWCYTFYNGGIALSNYHDMETATYENQLSVYDTSSPSGGNFVVAFGSSSIANPNQGKYSDYDGCAHVYLTDAKGYFVANPGADNSKVSGEDKEGWFKSVWINNTTYDFLTIKNGNAFTQPLNEENEGWFKVQFIAFEDDDANETPIGYTEAYLANFKKGQADDYIGIVDEWIKVDLSSLPECSILVINFVGSDTGEYGLNTPAYCALDKFEIHVEK